MIHSLQQFWQRSRPRSRSAQKISVPRIVLFGIFFGLALGAVLAVPLSQAALVRKGEPSPITVEAPSQLTYVSEVQTRVKKTEAANDPRNIAYQTDLAVLPAQRTLLVTTLDSLTNIRRNAAFASERKVSEITKLAALPITTETATTIVDLTPEGWQRVVDESRRIYDQQIQSFGNRLTEDDVATIRTRTLPYLPTPSDFSGQQRDLVIFFISSVLRPNTTVDQVTTEQNRAQAMAVVEPVKRSIARGQNIVRRGDIVTEETFEALTQLGIVRGVGGLIATLQQFLLGLLVASVFTIYLSFGQRRLLTNGRALAVIGALLVVAVGAARLVLPSWHNTPYAFPFATVGVMLAVIFNSELALVAVMLFAPLIGLQSEASIGLSLTLALGSAAGIFTASRAQRTSTFALTGLSVTVATALSALVFWLDDQADMQWLASPLANAALIITVFSLLNGILSAVLTLGTSHFLSRAANVVTPLQLMELSHPNHPLLRRLMRDAPGTYHHSMVVSNLVEVAAESIGADPLLARVGAYYHDVGKILRPYFYTDNQHDRGNVHDELDAKTSASVIIDHVREGAKLAAQYRLPQQIIDFIPQHHGTNVVSYFYQRALQEDEEVDLALFCYPGPKPQTREAAILMMADGIEATVRAKAQAGKLAPSRPDDDMPRPKGATTIEETVAQIVQERINDHQLDESPLTLHDIATIKESFIRTLQGIYHPRVDYTQQRAKKV